MFGSKHIISFLFVIYLCNDNYIVTKDEKTVLKNNKRDQNECLIVYLVRIDEVNFKSMTFLLKNR